MILRGDKSNRRSGLVGGCFDRGADRGSSQLFGVVYVVAAGCMRHFYD